MLPIEANDLLLVGSDNPTTWIIYNYLIREFGLFPALIEPSMPRSVLLRNRIKKLGLFKTLSQVAFVTTIRRLLERRDARRVREICRANGLEALAPMTTVITPIESVNSEACRELLRKHAPKIIIVNGTRIIKRETLNAIPATFINTHQGITPMYRGAHGAYWAVVNDDPANCGVTVHLIDEGIDTGDIIEQAIFKPTPDDSFVTYPYLQTALALPILKKTIAALRAGTLETRHATGTSAVWYHPGFFEYIINAMRGRH